MKTFLPKSGLLTFGFLITNLFFASGAFAQATVITEFDDYAPGSTANITGAGFQPGEEVELHVQHADGDPLGNDPLYHEPWSVTADSLGDFTTRWYVPTQEEGDAAGATLNLEANGNLGSIAKWTFTDSVLSVTIISPITTTPVSVRAGCNFSVNYTVAINNNGADGTATISIKSGTSTIVSVIRSNIPKNQASTYTDNLTIPLNTTIGSYNVEVSVTQQNNVVSTATNALNVTAALTTANAGSDQTVCATTVTLAGNTVAVGIGTWTLVSGSGSITSLNSPTSGVTVLGLGANTFRWTISEGGCSNSDDVVITRNDNPTTSNAGPDQAVCATTATLNGNTVTTGTGTWTLVSGAGTITTSSSRTSGITALGVGANTFRWTIANPPCTSSTDDVVITRSVTPTASAGGSQTICQNGTAIISGASSSNGTILWTHNGAGSLSNATTLAPTYIAAAGDAGTTVTLIMTVSNSPCTAVTATYIIVVKATPTASAGGSQTICQNGTAIISGASSSNGTILWTHNGAGSLSNETTLTPTYTAAASDAEKTVTLTMTVTNSPCTAASAFYSVIVKSTPTVSISGTITSCQGSSSPNITFTNPQTLPISITYNVNGGTNSTINMGASSTATVSAPTTSAGTFVYNLVSAVYQVAPACSNSISGTATVIIRATPTATIAINGANPICSGSTTSIKFTGPNNGIVTYNINGGIDLFTAPIKNGGNFILTTTALDSDTTYNLVSVAYGDAPGCSAPASGSVTITVNQTPVFTACPSNISQNTDVGVCTAVVSYASNVTGTPTPTLTYTFTGATTGSGSGTGSGSTFNKGATTVTITASNLCSPSVTCVFTVTVNDTQAPTIVALPVNISVNNNAGVCGTIISWTAPTSADNCAGSTIAQTAGAASGTVFPIGVSTITYTATDAALNTFANSFTITVADNELPTIVSLPENISVYNNTGVCGATVSWTASTSADNCAGSTIAQTAGLANGATFPIGISTVTYTATDAASNTFANSFTVTVTDDEDPTIVALPGNISVNNDAGVCGAAVSWTAPTSADNCAGSTIAQTAGLANGATFPIGVSTITYTATDASSNTFANSFTITVIDNELPTIVCPDNIVLTACQSTAIWSTPTATDNCSEVTVVRTAGPVSGSAFGFGTTTTIAYEATDAAGKKKACSFTVTRAAELSAVITSSNPNVLYFGLSGNQSTTITTTPTGGNGPHTIEYILSRPLLCNINGGSETWTSGSGTSTGNVCPSTTPISTATLVSSYSITINLMADAIVITKVTDKFGCVSTAIVKIWAEDVRCFAGKSGNAKVKMCHQTGSPTNPCTEICVDESAVQTHLNQGDVVGVCGTSCQGMTHSRPVVIGKEEIKEIPEFNVLAYPNPSNYQFNIKVIGGSAEQVEVVVYDMLAREIKRITKPNAKDIQFGEDLPRGEYLLLVRQGENQKAINVIKK